MDRQIKFDDMLVLCSVHLVSCQAPMTPMTHAIFYTLQLFPSTKHDQTSHVIRKVTSWRVIFFRAQILLSQPLVQGDESVLVRAMPAVSMAEFLVLHDSDTSRRKFCVEQIFPVF